MQAGLAGPAGARFSVAKELAEPLVRPSGVLSGAPLYLGPAATEPLFADRSGAIPLAYLTGCAVTAGRAAAAGPSAGPRTGRVAETSVRGRLGGGSGSLAFVERAGLLEGDLIIWASVISIIIWIIIIVCGIIMILIVRCWSNWIGPRLV